MYGVQHIIIYLFPNITVGHSCFFFSNRFLDSQCKDDEDEIYFGAITEKEKRKAAKFYSRKTALFASDFRENGAVLSSAFGELSLEESAVEHVESAHSNGSPESTPTSISSLANDVISSSSTSLKADVTVTVQHGQCSECCTNREPRTSSSKENCGILSQIEQVPLECQCSHFKNLAAVTSPVPSHDLCHSSGSSRETSERNSELENQSGLSTAQSVSATRLPGEANCAAESNLNEKAETDAPQYEIFLNGMTLEDSLPCPASRLSPDTAVSGNGFQASIPGHKHDKDSGSTDGTVYDQIVPGIEHLDQGSEDSFHIAPRIVDSNVCDDLGENTHCNDQDGRHIMCNVSSGESPDVSILTFANTTKTADMFDLNGSLFDCSLNEGPTRNSQSSNCLQRVCESQDHRSTATAQGRDSDASSGDMNTSHSNISTKQPVRPVLTDILGGGLGDSTSQSSHPDQVVFTEKHFSPIMTVTMTTPPQSDFKEIFQVREGSGKAGSMDTVSPNRGVSQTASEPAVSSETRCKKVRKKPNLSVVTPSSSVFDRLYAYRKTPPSSTRNSKLSPKPGLNNTQKKSLKLKAPGSTQRAQSKTIGSPVVKQFTPCGVKKDLKNSPRIHSPSKTSKRSLFEWPAASAEKGTTPKAADVLKPEGKRSTSSNRKRTPVPSKSPTGGATGIKILTTGVYDRKAVTTVTTSDSRSKRQGRQQSDSRKRPPIFRQGTPRHLPNTDGLAEPADAAHVHGLPEDLPKFSLDDSGQNQTTVEP